MIWRLELDKYSAKLERTSGRFMAAGKADHPPLAAKERRPTGAATLSRGRVAWPGKSLVQKPVTKRANISNADAVRAVEHYRSNK